MFSEEYYAAPLENGAFQAYLLLNCVLKVSLKYRMGVGMAARLVKLPLGTLASHIRVNASASNPDDC